MGRASPRRRAGRGAWLRLAILRAAGIAVLCELCLVGATNLVLRSDWLAGLINADPATLLVTHTGARSFLPGRLRFDALVLRSRDPNIEWEARLEDVSVRFRLSDLVRRRFRAVSVRAGSLAFRLRERLEENEATPARLARYPAIAGFPMPPLRDPPAPPGSPGNPWRIVVDDLAVRDVREIWVDSWNWTGSATIAGGLDLLSGLRAEVYPAELSVASGVLRFGGHEVSRNTRGAVRASLPLFDTRRYAGNEVWKIISGTAVLHGTLQGLEFLSADGDGPRFAGGAGSARVGIVLDRGRGSARVEAEARRLVARAGKRVLRGNARVRVRARAIDFHEGHATLNGTSLAVSDLSLDGAGGEAWSGSVTATAARLGIADGSLDARLVARLRDARPLVALLPAGPPKWLAGLLDLRDFEASGRVARAPGRLTISGASAQAGTFALAGDYRESKRGAWGAVLIRKGGLSAGVGIRPAGTAFHLAGAAAWFESEGLSGGLRTDRPRESEEPGAARPGK